MRKIEKSYRRVGRRLRVTVPLLAVLLAVCGYAVAARAQVEADTTATAKSLHTAVAAPGSEATVEAELHPEKYKGERTISADTVWHTDILEGYEARSVNLGDSFDGPVVCTVVRRRCGGGKGVLYVHGFNDYFFQKEMGERFNARGINFYAVDLRRYGRSLRPWQYPFNVRDMREYFEDIDAALALMRRDGITDITLSGHSTGGLTTALYTALHGARCGVKRLVTDSPFLEWNFNAFYRNALIPAVTLWGALSPNTKINQGDCDAYSHSLLRRYHGEWEYNTDWKMVYSPPVTASWIRAVSRAQSKLMKNGRNITVPVLVMHSSRGLHECRWTPQCMDADIVLNPTDLQKRGQKLGKEPVVAAIEDGIHDLILSRPRVREAAYDTIFRFIDTH